jgi:hypothetical protein
MNPDPDRSTFYDPERKKIRIQSNFRNPGFQGVLSTHVLAELVPRYGSTVQGTHVMVKLADLSIVCMLENCWRKPPSNSSTSILLEPPPSFTPPLCLPLVRLSFHSRIARGPSPHYNYM